MLFVLCEDINSEFWKYELIFSRLKIPTVFKSHWNWVFLSLHVSFKQTKANGSPVPPEHKDNSSGSGTGSHHAAVTLVPVPAARATFCTHLPPAAFLSLLWKLTAVCCDPLAQPSSMEHRAGREVQRITPGEERRSKDPAAVHCCAVLSTNSPALGTSLTPLTALGAVAGTLLCTALTTICWELEQGSPVAFIC